MDNLDGYGEPISVGDLVEYKYTPMPGFDPVVYPRGKGIVRSIMYSRQVTVEPKREIKGYKVAIEPLHPSDGPTFPLRTDLESGIKVVFSHPEPHFMFAKKDGSIARRR